MKFFSSDAAPEAMYEYAHYLSDKSGDETKRKDPERGVKIFDELVDRYTAETTIGGYSILEASAVLLEQSKRSAAITRLEKLASAQEGYILGAEARIRLGDVYQNEGSSRKALSEYDKAREDNTTRSDQLSRSYLGSAKSYIALGNTKAAHRILSELLATRGMGLRYRKEAKTLLDSITPKKNRKKKR